MELFDELSKEDREKISNYIRAYGSNDSSDNGLEPTESLDYLLRFWNSHKKDLYKLFGNKFILSKEVEYLQPIEDIKENIDRLQGEHNYNFPDLLSKKLQDFLIQDIIDYDTLSRCMFLVSSSTLAVNKYVGETFSITYKDKKITCQEGTKPFRVLGKLAKVLGIEKEYEEFRLGISVATNQRKLKGTLCLSIHPMDYLTMSDNECGWSSCMSWKEYGCYRMGTVEMMNSDNVIVAYLASENEMTLPDNQKWNSKKWRSLFIVDDRATISIKGYPYQSSDLVMSVLNWIKELTGEKYSYIDSIPYRQKFIYDNKRIYLSTNTFSMYNDFGRDVIHYGMFNKTLNSTDNEEVIKVMINYSGETECMCCGGTVGDFNSEGDLICTACDSRQVCECCGEFVNEDEIYELDGSVYCQDCYDDFAVLDELTNEYHHEDNMTDIYAITKKQLEQAYDKYALALLHNNNYIKVYNDTTLYDESLLAELSDDCESHVKTDIEFGGGYINYILVDDLGNYGLKLFNIESKEEYEREMNDEN